MQCNVAVTEALPPARLIRFDADEVIARQMDEFGGVIAMGKNSYYMTVNARFDFSAVLEYLKSMA
jgi:hypothetical protein